MRLRCAAARCHPSLARLFRRYNLVFHDDTKKAVYASGLAEERLIPAKVGYSESPDPTHPANVNFIPVGFAGEVQENSVCCKSNRANSSEVTFGEVWNLTLPRSRFERSRFAADAFACRVSAAVL